MNDLISIFHTLPQVVKILFVYPIHTHTHTHTHTGTGTPKAVLVFLEQTLILKTVLHREISSVLCDHLEGWDREGGREGDARGKSYGDICICITDSLCYKAETNTPL